MVSAYKHTHTIKKTHLNGVTSSWNPENRTVCEVGGELVTVHSGAHQNQVEVWTFLQNFLQDNEQEIWVDTSLMDLMERQHEISHI